MPWIDLGNSGRQMLYHWATGLPLWTKCMGFFFPATYHLQSNNELHQCTFSPRCNLPKHWPSKIQYPSVQEQVYPPSVLMQIWVGLHWCLSVTHSSISATQRWVWAIKASHNSLDKKQNLTSVSLAELRQNTHTHVWRQEERAKIQFGTVWTTAPEALMSKMYHCNPCAMVLSAKASTQQMLDLW